MYSVPLDVNLFLNCKRKEIEDLIQCMKDISDKILEQNVVIVSNIIFTKTESKNNSFLLMNINKSLSVIGQGQKDNLFILIFENLNRLRKWFSDVKELDNWNPHGKFIVAVLDRNQKNVSAIFEVLWEFYILNVYVVFQYDTSAVFSYNPYEDTVSCNNLNIKKVFDCTSIPLHNLFPNKIPLDLRQCRITFFVLKLPPFVIETGKRDSASQVGLEVIIMNTLADRMNFEDHYMEHNYSVWGSRHSNGTFTDLYGKLQSKKVDIIYGLIANVYKEFGSLEQAVYDTTVWYVPTALKQPLWLNVINIYRKDVWLYIVGCIVVYSSVWWLFGNILNDSLNFRHFTQSMLLAWYILLQGMLHSPVHSITIRLLVLLWLVFSILVGTAYQSQLLTILMNPRYEHQISTASELLASNLKYGFYTPVTSFFSDPEDPIQRQILKSYKTCPLTVECLNRTAFKRDFAVVKSQKQVSFLMRLYYTDQEGNPLLHKFDKGYMIFPKFNVIKGFPLIARFNSLIMLMHSGGLIEKWEQDIMSMGKIPVTYKVISLSFEHVKFAFICLVIGLTISGIVFIYEVICNRFYTNKNNNLKYVTNK